MANVSLKIENKKTVADKSKLLIPGMEEVEKELYFSLSNSHGKTYDVCNNLLKSGGKRIRPLLVLTSSQCFGTLEKNTVNAAVASELIHMASLVHDDIIDNATTRRNKPSVNILLGNQSSVLIGDYLFAKAFEILSKNKLIEVLQLMVDAIGEMCDGEITQASNKFNFNQSSEEYYNRIYKKTGILISSCCHAGAVLGGANEEEIECLRIYGTNIGYAYQIVDDILDFVGHEDSVGKPVTRDLREGNVTLPIIKLIENSEYKRWLEDITKNGEISDGDYKEVLRVLNDSYAIQETYKEVENCISAAKKSLNKVRDTKYKDLLMTLADELMVREK